MKNAAVLGAKDEIDQIRPAIAHLRAIGVDHVIAVDGGSTDGTAEVVAGEAEGHGFELMPFADIGDEGAEAEMRSAGRALGRARRAGADRVLFRDADEFWLPATGRLGDTAAWRAWRRSRSARLNVPLLPKGPAIPVPIAPGGYPDLLLHAPDEPRKATMARVRRDAAMPWIAAIPVEKVTVRPDAAATTGSGHHSGLDAEGRPVPTVRPCDLVIAHVPFTTEARFARKVADIATVVAASGHRWGPDSAWHWRRWMEAGEDGAAEEVAPNTITLEALAGMSRSGAAKSAAELLSRLRS